MSDWNITLRDAALTLDPEKVEEAALHIINSFSAHFPMLERVDDSHDWDHKENAFNHMKEYVMITHEVVAQTLLPGKQRAAAACTIILVDCMRALADELRHLEEDWDDANIDDVFFSDTFPVGDTNSALMCYLAQMSVWTGWCRRGTMMLEIISESKPLPRALERCARTFAALHGLTELYTEHTNYERWQILATESLVMNCNYPGGILHMEEEEGGFNNDPTVMLRGISKPVPHTPDDMGMSLNPIVHSMFQHMYTTRKAMQELAGEEDPSNPLVSQEMIDVCTMRAARVFINEQKEIYYRSLWQRWFLLWRTISRWTKATGEHQCMTGGRIWAAALAEYDADMGGRW
jgi:hypothetical protein